jgi:hypothetical protein
MSARSTTLTLSHSGQRIRANAIGALTSVDFWNGDGNPTSCVKRARFLYESKQRERMREIVAKWWALMEERHCGGR